MLITIAVFLFTRQLWRYVMLHLKSSAYGITFFRTLLWWLQCCGHSCGLWLCVELFFFFFKRDAGSKGIIRQAWTHASPPSTVFAIWKLCFWIPYAPCSMVELCEFTQKLVSCAGDGVACVWQMTALTLFIVAGFSACPKCLLGHGEAWLEWTISEEIARREITIKRIWKLWALI